MQQEEAVTNKRCGSGAVLWRGFEFVLLFCSEVLRLKYSADYLLILLLCNPMDASIVDKVFLVQHLQAQGFNFTPSFSDPFLIQRYSAAVFLGWINAESIKKSKKYGVA